MEIDHISDNALRPTASGLTARMVAWPILPSLLGVPLPSVRIPIKLSAAIPLIFGAGMIADMDVIGFLTVDPVRRKSVFDGKVDEFPAYEAYVSVDRGPPLTLFRQSILAGKTPRNLMFMPTLRPQPGEVTF